MLRYLLEANWFPTVKTLLAIPLLTLMFSCTAEKQPSSTPLAEQLGVAVEPSGQASKTSPAKALHNLQRIKIATVGAKDLQQTQVLYQNWLGYQIVEEGLISEQLANSWGASAMAGKPYTLLQSQSGDDVFLRVIEVSFPDNYQAMTTYGWNAIELIVQNPDAIYQKLSASPFQHLGGPANLGQTSIRATQFKGPSEEVFYFTADLGDQSKSSLLQARAEIDRPFIMVVAGPDARQLMDFYSTTLGSEEAFFIKMPINVLSSAQNMPADHPYPLGFLRLAEFSHSIEVDGYPTNKVPRQVAQGELPPGVSITTFSVQNLELIDPELFITKPFTAPGTAYGGNRAATLIGPAGELVELIEEKQTP